MSDVEIESSGINTWVHGGNTNTAMTVSRDGECHYRPPPTAGARSPSEVEVFEEDRLRLLRRGVTLCCISLSLLIGGWAVCAPFLQSRRDELGCDAPCAGTVTSIRSVLELVGSALVGRMSDVSGWGSSGAGTTASVDAKGGDDGRRRRRRRGMWGFRWRLPTSWRWCRCSMRRLMVVQRGSLSGRIACLHLGAGASFVGWLMTLRADTMRGLVISQVPNALLQKNATVMRALIAEYHEALESVQSDVKVDEGAHVEEDIAVPNGGADESSSGKGTKKTVGNDGPGRADSMGKLGMSVGLAVMVGPFLGATGLVTTYDSAIGVALLLTVLSAAGIAMLPRPPTRQRPPAGVVADSKSHSYRVSASSPLSDDEDSCKEPGGRNLAAGWMMAPYRLIHSSSLSVTSDPTLLLMTMRTCMTLAYHIFAVAWVPSLRGRFGFRSSDHAKFMSFVGLSYALSQGVIARIVIRRFGGDDDVGGGAGDGPKVGRRGHGYRGRVRLILICCLTLGFGRYLAFQTSNLPLVYLIFYPVVTALGILNTILSVDASRVAPPDGLGSLFGSLEAAENGAGIVGPMMGGYLGGVWPVDGPLAAVLVLYGIVFSLVYLRYEEVVLRRADARRIVPPGRGRVVDDRDDGGDKVVEATAADHEEVMMSSGSETGSSSSSWLGRRHQSTAKN